MWTRLAQIGKYFHGTDTQVLAGALLGVGIVNCNIKNECDPVSYFGFYASVRDYSFVVLNSNFSPGTCTLRRLYR